MITIATPVWRITSVHGIEWKNSLASRAFYLKSRYLSRAANSLFSTFPKIGPVPLTYLFSSYCLALYGCELWNLSSPGLRSLEVILNKCLRRIWRLPSTTHTCILHRCAGVQSIFNTVHSRFLNFIKNAKVSSNYLVRAIFSQDLAYTPAGLNSLCGYKFLKNYSTEDGLSGTAPAK